MNKKMNHAMPLHEQLGVPASHPMASGAGQKSKALAMPKKAMKPMPKGMPPMGGC